MEMELSRANRTHYRKRYMEMFLLRSQISDIHFRLMNAVVGFLAISKVPTLNIERMCRDWGIGKRKLYELPTVMNATE